MPTTYCSPSGLIHSCSVVYRRSPGFSPAKVVLLLLRLHFGPWPRPVWHKRQRDHFGRRRLAAHLDGQLPADLAHGDRHVTHDDALLARGLARPTGDRADLLGVAPRAP